MTDPLSIVALISGGGSNLQAIIDACAVGRICGQVHAVISNQADAYGLQRARKANIPALIIDHTTFKNRIDFETELCGAIDSYQPGLVVLAGFMRILNPPVIHHFLGRMLNIHPSLLPELPGLNTHQRAIDAGFKSHGASVHFVTPELDAGPVVLQARVPVLPTDNAETLAARVLTEEHRIYPAAIDWYARGRLRYRNDRAELDGATITDPASLLVHAQ